MRAYDDGGGLIGDANGWSLQDENVAEPGGITLSESRQIVGAHIIATVPR